MNHVAWVAATISMFMIGCEPRRSGDAWSARVMVIDRRTGRLSVVAVRETTVREYGAFVRWIEATGDHRWCHPDEPPAKSHRPGSVRPRYLADPCDAVVGVDWFDAYAYCAWRGGRLPTREEWFDAARSTAGCRTPGDRTPGDWTPETTPRALVDLESGVSEWCDDRNANDEAPVCGGNRFLDERSARRVIVRPRRHRQASVGFRVAWPARPRGRGRLR